MTTVNGQPSPEGVISLLDTDLYKLTMQCAVLKYFPDISVSYKFTNRTPHMKLNRAAFNWLQTQVDKLGNIRVTDEEIKWLDRTCPFFSKEYLEFLKTFYLRPAEQLSLTFAPVEGSAEGDAQPGEVAISISGIWVETILYEIPLLALVSEAYFKFVDTDWNHNGQLENAKQKGVQLLEAGCAFSEFGSRRRRDYRTHEIVMTGLLEAQKEAQSKGFPGKFSGTSNVHFAMKYGVAPVGTVAHEWFMGIAALTGDYAGANEKALQYWTGAFGQGVLSIALTDTFGTPAFLKAFTCQAPKSHTTNEVDGNNPTYAQIFTGTRQDSGDPLDFIQLMRNFYDSQGITDAKSIVFSDSLNVEKCIKYKKATEAAGLTPAFGVGTFFTNDFAHLSKTDEKSVPLNIVIKLSEAKGVPAVKLSDDKGKNMGPEDLVRKVKGEIGYTDKSWADEAHRWG
ncbi:hypothetical protein Q7P37_007009 [Cladosporium fusiforme]